jgi:hypothetical protein
MRQKNILLFPRGSGLLMLSDSEQLQSCISRDHEFERWAWLTRRGVHNVMAYGVHQSYLIYYCVASLKRRLDLNSGSSESPYSSRANSLPLRAVIRSSLMKIRVGRESNIARMSLPPQTAAGLPQGRRSLVFSHSDSFPITTHRPTIDLGFLLNPS